MEKIEDKMRVKRLSAILLSGLCVMSLIGCGPKGDNGVVADPVDPAGVQHSDNDQQSDNTEVTDNAWAQQSLTDNVPDLEKAFEEREAFIESQQIPTGVRTIAPVTEQQKAFIAAISEDSASEPSGDDVSDILSLALNLCEHGILNGHRIDTALLKNYVETSPIIARVVSSIDSEEVVLNMMNVAVRGTSFLCPDDFPAWLDAYGIIAQGGAQTESIR